MVVTHATWIDYCLRSLRGRSVPNDTFDGLVESYLNDDEKYLNSILEYQGSNFMDDPDAFPGQDQDPSNETIVGNHKSAENNADEVKLLFSKDVQHGFSLPISPGIAPKLRGAMVQPCGMVRQFS